jgi:hypothetical protein
LINGNKRLGLAAVIAFYGLNGRRLTLTNDQAHDLVMKVAAGELDQVEEIAAIRQAATAPAHDVARARRAIGWLERLRSLGMDDMATPSKRIASGERDAE